MGGAEWSLGTGWRGGGEEKSGHAHPPMPLGERGHPLQPGLAKHGYLKSCASLGPAGGERGPSLHGGKRRGRAGQQAGEGAGGVGRGRPGGSGRGNTEEEIRRQKPQPGFKRFLESGGFAWVGGQSLGPGERKTEDY